MPRRVRTRKIAEGLEELTFRPQPVARRRPPRVITLDGLEALRLADLEGLYQTEAARRMGISRATFGRVLSTAREAVADALVHGKAVAIRGGEVAPRADRLWPCPVHGTDSRRGRGCLCGPPDGSAGA